MRFLSHVCYQAPRSESFSSHHHIPARVKTLLEMFPARFVHIVRDPYTVFASTVNLWKTLYTKHGLQTPRYEGLEEYVLQTFEQIYDKFERDRSLLGADQFCEIRYEDLVRDPRCAFARSTNSSIWANWINFSPRCGPTWPAWTATRPTATRN